jgi:hypothetical protein
VELTKIGDDKLVNLYHTLRSITGIDIGYFATDSRLFPFSAQSNNIFYAPAKLSDRRIDTFSNAPLDYFTIQAVDTNGNVVELRNLTSSTQISGYQITYNPMFYNSMIYRAFMGYGPSDVGQTTQGIPGISGSLASLPPMPGWNMTHFRMVYRTAYFNPFPQADVANHTTAWRAISFDDALILQAEIQAGTATGTVDLSAAGLEQGVVFLQYYDGAIINGTVTSSSGIPYAGIFVTVKDQYGIPHQMVQTDSSGHYSIIAPFGDTTVFFSNGDLDARLMTGANSLGSLSFNISKSQADRVADYQLNGDIVIGGNQVSGKVFWDINGDGTFTSGTDQIITGATVVIENQTTGFQIANTSTSTGYSFTGVPPLEGKIYALIESHVTSESTINTVSSVTKDIAIPPSTISGIVTLASGEVGSGVKLTLIDFTNGKSTDQTTLSNGSYSFTLLLSGQYQIVSAINGTTFGILPFGVSEGTTVTKDLTLFQALKVTGTTSIQGVPTGFVAVALTSSDLTQHAVSDVNGSFTFVVPEGNYSLSAFASANGVDYASLQNIAGATGSVTVNPALQPANSVVFKVTGTTVASGTEVRIQSRTTGAIVRAVTNSTGMFRAVLPTDNYFIYAQSIDVAYWADIFVFSSADQVINLVSAASISGQVWYDNNFNGVRDSGEGVTDVPLVVQDSNSRSIDVKTASDGSFAISLVPGLSYILVVSKSGYQTQTFTFDPLTSSVSKIIELIPQNRSVSATVTYLGSPLAGIEVKFIAAGQGAVSATAVTGLDGTISLTLHPGSYSVVVDQNVTAGNNATRYRFGSTIVVSVGKDPAALNIAVNKRILVTVALSGSFGALSTPITTITLDGPEKVTLTQRANATTYLMAGQYSVYGSAVSGGSRFASLSLQTVSESSTAISVAMEQAFTVRGNLQFEGRAFSNIVPVSLAISTEGTLNISSTAAGVFNANVPAGSYVAVADLRTKQPINGNQKYLRYQATTAFDLTANTEINIALTRTFDNATVSGTVSFNGEPVSANLQFVPADVTAMATNVTAVPSGYTTAIAPGNYSVYVKQTNGIGVFLGTVHVVPYVTNSLNFTLVAGLRFSGTTQVNGLGTSAAIQFSNTNFVAITSAVDGTFEVFLPTGAYAVTATASGTERGIAVSYQTTFELNLTAPATQTIIVSKVIRRSVEVQWNQAEKMTVTPGGTATYNIFVINKGDVADTFTLSALTAPTGWAVTFSQNPVSVDFGSTGNSQRVTVTITTPADAKVSHQAITIRAISTSASTASASVSVDVNIVPQYGVTLSLDSAVATTGTNFTYNIKVLNSGNIDDAYTVTISNLGDLTSLGWKAELKGSTGDFGSNATTSAAAGKSVDIQLRLVPIRANPDPRVTVVLVAISKAQPAVTSTLPFAPELPAFTVPGGGLVVSGNQVSNSPPVFPALTIALIGVMLIVFTLLILMSIQRGVFRRKR